MKTRDICALCLLTSIFMVNVPQAALAQHKDGQQAFNPSPLNSLKDDRRIILGTDLVSLTVTVTDASGRSVPGLDRQAFALFDNNVAQEISFFSDEDAPASVAIVFDVSGSMSEEKLVRAREALAGFIRTSHDEDQYFLISFASRAQLLLDGVRDGEAVLNKFTYVQPHGETALYDAVYLGIEKVSRGLYPKRAIIVISDGEDNHSLYSFNELRSRLQEADAVVYTIRVGTPSIRSQGDMIMKSLASVSGGKAFSPHGHAGMNEAFEAIALELRYQYSIGYSPSNLMADGKKHHIKVKVTPPPDFPRLAVRHREGYYATEEMRARRTGRPMR